ncbi:Fe2OG dioxygenase domain-containing protein [Balamuthia mandrillaris]
MAATRTTTASSQQQRRAPHVDELPAEVQRLVANLLEPQDKLRLRQASRRWLELVHSSSPALRRSIRVAALKGVSRALRQDSLFCCGGATELSHPLRLSFQKSVARTTTNEGEGEELVSGFLSFPLVKAEGTRRGSVEELEGEALAGLIKCCSAATFGKGSKEVLDPSYRRALQLSPDHFLTNFVPSENDILDKIERILAPNSWKVRAELYKLNVYPEGGHFKAHVDTPRGDGMFGSLVVCLPTCFQGGELVVRQAPSEVVFDLASTTKVSSAAGEQLAGDDGDPSQLNEPEGEAKRPQPKEAHPERCSVKWAAFYADCEHEILPVTAGHRITLTYNLYSERAQHLHEHKKEKEEEEEEEEEEERDEEEEEKDEEEEEKKYKTTAEKKAEPKNPREPECKQHKTAAEKKAEPKSSRAPNASSTKRQQRKKQNPRTQESPNASSTKRQQRKKQNLGTQENPTQAAQNGSREKSRTQEPKRARMQAAQNGSREKSRTQEPKRTPTQAAQNGSREKSRTQEFKRARTQAAQNGSREKSRTQEPKRARMQAAQNGSREKS